VTANHVFYIPAMLLVGFFLGMMFGKKQAHAEAAEHEREERERETRRARRNSEAGS
jgi:hypothetical protein